MLTSYLNQDVSVIAYREAVNMIAQELAPDGRGFPLAGHPGNTNVQTNQYPAT